MHNNNNNNNCYDDSDDNNYNQKWNIKAKVIPDITEATGTISKSFTQYVSNILGKYEIKELPKKKREKKKTYWALHTYFGKF